MCCLWKITCRVDIPVNRQSEGPSNSQKDLIIDRILTCTSSASGHVFLPTLKIVLDGNNGPLLVRALIDSGSQRSYILKSIADCAHLKPKRVDRIVLCVFGGTLFEQDHEGFDISCHGEDSSFCLEVLAQTVICNELLPINSDP